MASIYNLLAGIVAIGIISCSKEDVPPKTKFNRDDFVGSWDHGNYRDIALDRSKKDTLWDTWAYYPNVIYDLRENGDAYISQFNLKCKWELEDGEYLDISCADRTKVSFMNSERMVLLSITEDNEQIYHKYDTLIKLK